MRTLEELRLANADTSMVNDWDEIGPDDFDPDGDYEVTGHGSIQIVTPLSNAGRQWLYKHLPADCPRWGADGFAIEARYLDGVLGGMERDGLTMGARP